MTDTAIDDETVAEDSVQDRAASTGSSEQTNPKAYRLKEFCRVFGIGKTYAHSLIAQGILEKRYAGKRLLITRDSAESWFASLPDEPPRNRRPPSKGRVAE